LTAGEKALGALAGAGLEGGAVVKTGIVRREGESVRGPAGASDA